MHQKHYSVKIGSISFCSSFDMQKSHHHFNQVNLNFDLELNLPNLNLVSLELYVESTLDWPPAWVLGEEILRVIFTDQILVNEIRIYGTFCHISYAKAC